MRNTFAILFLSLGVAACSNNHAATESNDKRGRLEACELITKEEVATIQGSAIADTRSSASGGSDFRVSQCFYAASESNKSVTLALTQSNPEAKRNLKDYWNESFANYDAKRSKKREAAKEKVKKSSSSGAESKTVREWMPSKKINDLGEDAYWFSNAMGGALYALKNDAFIRISVGGPDDEQTKINKSKALAEKALERL